MTIIQRKQNLNKDYANIQNANDVKNLLVDLYNYDFEKDQVRLIKNLLSSNNQLADEYYEILLKMINKTKEKYSETTIFYLPDQD